MSLRYRELAHNHAEGGGGADRPLFSSFSQSFSSSVFSSLIGPKVSQKFQLVQFEELGGERPSATKVEVVLETRVGRIKSFASQIGNFLLTSTTYRPRYRARKG